jgi:O-antigen ligase
MAAWDHTGPGEIRPDAILDAASRTAAVVMLVIFTQAWVFPLVGDGAEATSAGGLVRALYVPAYLVGAVFLWRSRREAGRALLRQPFLVALLLIATLSTVWSLSPDQTPRRVFALACTSFCGLVLGARYSWARLAEALAAAFAIVSLGSLAAALALPSIGLMHELFPGAWRGLWAEKNALGGYMAIGTVISTAAAVLNPRRRRLWASFAALSIFLVLMSTSKTALLSLLIGLGVLGFVGLARRGPAAGVATGWLAVMGIALVAAVAVFAADLFFAVLGKDATFTGRTQIWAAVMKQIAERPWTGFGYGVVWDLEGAWGPLAQIIKDAGFTPRHAHNAWLEAWLGLGVFGLATFGLAMFQTTALTLVAVFSRPGAYLAAPYLAVYLLTTLTESVGAIYNSVHWVIFCALSARLVTSDAEPAQSPSRRTPSATVTTSNPALRPSSMRRPQASGVQPQGEGSSRTSWV